MSDIDRKIDELLTNNMWVDVKTGKVNFAHARKDILALMNEARINTAEKLAKKAIRYDTHDPVIDKDNWAIPYVAVTDYIAGLKPDTKQEGEISG